MSQEYFTSDEKKETILDIPENLNTFFIRDLRYTKLDGYNYMDIRNTYNIDELEKTYAKDKCYTWNTDNKKELGKIVFGMVTKENSAIIDGKEYEVIIYDTIHTYSYYAFFKPTIYEVMSQIPRKVFEKYRNEKIYITTIFAGMSKSQLNHYGLTILLVPKLK